MARWAPLKKDQLEALATEILHNYARGRAAVAVDGRYNAGQKEFADGLADALRAGAKHVFRASMDDFFQPRAERDRAGWLDPKAHYRSAYDYSLFRRVLLDPFRTAGSTGFVLTGFDEQRDQPVTQPKWMSAGADAVLVVDGVYLHRPELAPLWNYSVWVTRTQAHPTTELETRGAEADEFYIQGVDPSMKATAIIDNTDPEHPRRVFEDSC
jgi:uridine kinase